MFHLLVHTLNGCKGQSWAGQSQEPEGSSGSTPLVQGPKDLDHVLLISHACYQGAGLKGRAGT